jgi:hypothetical protein
MLLSIDFLRLPKPRCVLLQKPLRLLFVMSYQIGQGCPVALGLGAVPRSPLLARPGVPEGVTRPLEVRQGRLVLDNPGPPACGRGRGPLQRHAEQNDRAHESDGGYHCGHG